MCVTDIKHFKKQVSVNVDYHVAPTCDKCKKSISADLYRDTSELM